MRLFSKKCYFDKNFKLTEEFIYKSCVNFDYSNIYKDNFVVQGFCISKDYCMVSAYCRCKLNSRIYLYEKSGSFNKFIELNNNAHVGGISYDAINDIVFVTGNKGKINAYDYSELISGSIKEYQCNVDISKVLDGIVSAATVYFYKNSLYVCTFSNVGRMVKFNIEIDRRKNVINIKEYTVYNELPACIQGVCVFEENNELYYLFSQSFGRLKSIIKVYDNNFNFIGQKVLNSIGVEGIDLDYIGNVVCVFENGVSVSKKVALSEICCRCKKGLEKKLVSRGRFHQTKLEKIQ